VSANTLDPGAPRFVPALRVRGCGEYIRRELFQMGTITSVSGSRLIWSGAWEPGSMPSARGANYVRCGSDPVTCRPPAGANKFAAGNSRSPPSRTRRPGHARRSMHRRVRDRGLPHQIRKEHHSPLEIAKSAFADCGRRCRARDTEAAGRASWWRIRSPRRRTLCLSSRGFNRRDGAGDAPLLRTLRTRLATLPRPRAHPSRLHRHGHQTPLPAPWPVS
jgi:hypothetical protein